MSLNDFEFREKLGTGSFGSVYIVKRKENQKIYAMKRVKLINLGEKEKQNSFNEVRLLASFSHPNIIGYKEAFFDEKSSTLNIVMEYADDGDLSSKIKDNIKKHLQFDENTIWSILIQILEGLNYLHKSRIIHRDLKSANIFLTKKGIVKIGDLNVSIIAKKNLAVTQTGTPYYAAPEVWEHESYNNKCDLWSVGCITYEMACLRVPFRGTSIHQLYLNIMKGKYEEIPNVYSNDLKNIIRLILCLDPVKRPSAEDLLNNDTIKRKIKEIGIHNWENNETAMLMKTIKIPNNFNQINLQLPQKQYSKEHNIEQMMKNDEYETAKQNYYRPESAGKIISTQKKFNFNFDDMGRNYGINEDKKMKTLDEEKIVEKLLDKKDSNKIKKETKNNNKKLNKENTNSSLTLLLDNNEEQKEKNSEKYSFNSSIPEYIQGTPIYYNNQLIEEKKEQNETKETKEETNQKNKKERKLSYEGPEQNKFSNIDYILGETDNKENDTNKKNEENNNKNDIDNISLKKNSGNGSSKLDKIKSSLNKLIIGQNENKKNSKNNNRNKQPLEKRTIKRREKSEIINTEPVNLNLNLGFNRQNKSKKKFKDTKNDFCMFIRKKKIDAQNIRNIYLKDKPENNAMRNRIKTLDNNRNDNHHLSTANEALPKINKFGKISSTIATNKEKMNLKFKKNSDLSMNHKQKNKSISFLLEKDLHSNNNINSKTPFKNKKINLNNIIQLRKNTRNHVNINNYLIPSHRSIIPNSKQMNKKELKIELNKLKIISDRTRRNSAVYEENSPNANSNKVRPNSVKFKNNAPALRPLSSNRGVYSVKKEKNNPYTKSKKNNSMPKNNINYTSDDKDYGISPVLKDKDDINNENIFYQPNVGGYKLFYNHYYQNFLNLKSNEKNEHKDKQGVHLYFNKINNNSNDEYDEEKGRRKVIYEKIKIEKKGEETKYNGGDQEIKYVGMGNHYNRYNVVLSKFPNLLKINNDDYGIQNLNNLNKNKNHKDGPMVILPNKMLN